MNAEQFVVFICLLCHSGLPPLLTNITFTRIAVICYRSQTVGYLDIAAAAEDANLQQKTVAVGEDFVRER